MLSAESAFLSDFDGTLVGLAEHPDAVSPSPELALWLQQLRDCLKGALAIVTGRRLADVDRYLHPLRLIGAGAHGAELRASSEEPTNPIIAPLESALVAALETTLADLPGVWVENKTFALAVHFRQNPTAADECCARVQRVAQSFPQIEVFSGHSVIEVRSKGPSKGAAARFLLTLPAFAGRVPVFVGDDLADEEGFLVVQALGGHGVKVGAGETSAHYRLTDVEAVHRWINESLQQLKTTS